MGRRSELSIAKQREAVLVLLRREEAAARLAHRYGVSEQTLYRWRDEFLAAGEAALADSSGKNSDPRERRIEELERALAQRDQVIWELAIANRVSRHAANGLL